MKISNSDTVYDVAVIGGGAAGLMAAYSAAEYGAKTLLIEQNQIVGKKLLITGKGRCNVTNNCDTDTLISNTRTNPRFLYSAFANFDSADCCAFFERLGVPLKTERGNRVFPQSDRSVDIVDAFSRALKEVGVIIKTCKATHIMSENGLVCGVITDAGQLLARSVIIATGGLSYPATGSTGDGYLLAKECAHKIVPTAAALIPIECDGRPEELMGLSLRNTGLSVLAGEKLIYRDQGELLFTHFGLSGPMILSASSHMKAGENYRILLDLKPALDFKTLDARILRDFNENLNRQFKNSLAKLLPSKMIPYIIRRSGIDGEKPVNVVTKEERAALVSLIKGLSFTFKRFRPIKEAIITSGGVDVACVSAKTMESKLVKGLYFAGEVIDVDAYTGGFNLQIAFSTGRLAGQSAAMAL